MKLGRVILVLAVASCALAADPAPALPTSVESLSWMSGAWRMEGPPAFEESWTRPAGGTMLAIGRTIANGKTVFFEFLRVEERPDGLVYVGQPKGRAGAEFRLVRAGPQEAVFENLQHDFPKRIIYRRLDADTLFARVEGDGTESERAEDYRYTRVATP
jgi:hypothetical protein